MAADVIDHPLVAGRVKSALDLCRELEAPLFFGNGAVSGEDQIPPD